MKKAEKAGRRIDVRDGKHSDVKEPEEAAPRVLVFHDSVLKGVEWDRLDLAYGLHSKAQKVYRAADISDALKLHKNTEHQPDCVLMHVGVNDINRVSDIKASSDIMAKATKEVRGAMKTKVVSLPAPVLPARLDAKREIYTALLKAELLGEKDVVTVHHNYLSSDKLQTDGIHPTRAGTSVLAATLGRFLHRLFWEKPRRRKAAYHQRPFHMSSPPRAGFYAGPPPRQILERLRGVRTCTQYGNARPMTSLTTTSAGGTRSTRLGTDENGGGFSLWPQRMRISRLLWSTRGHIYEIK
jgi:hypothetical protein